MVPPFTQSKRSLLVVDDEADTRTLLSDYLVAEGFEVVQAGDGIDALSYLYARGGRRRCSSTSVCREWMWPRSSFARCGPIARSRVSPSSR